MILKRKKNAKLIYEPKNKMYYIDRITHISEFQDIQEAFREYGKISKIEKEQGERYYKNGYLHYELLPNQALLLIKAIQMMKYFVDTSRFFECDVEDLKSKSIDLFYLEQIIMTEYYHYVPKKVQSHVEEIYNFRNYKKQEREKEAKKQG